MKIAISLLSYNDIVYLKPCIDSLLSSDLNEHEYKFFIIDNNSSNSTKEYIINLNVNKWLKLNTENEGITLPRIEIMNNILNEDFDYTLEIHADMLFPKKWLNELIKNMDDETAIVMPFILNNPNLILDIENMNKLVEKYQSDEIFTNIRQVHPWLLNNSIVKKIGYYDSIFSPQNCEDDDFMWNVMKNKYKTKASKKSIVVHYGGKTRNFVNIEYDLQKSFRLFYNKNNITVSDMVSKFTFVL